MIGLAQPALAGAQPPQAKASYLHFTDADVSALHDYAREVGLEQPRLDSFREAANPHSQFADADFAALREYAQRVQGGQNEPAGLDESRKSARTIQ